MLSIGLRLWEGTLIKEWLSNKFNEKFPEIYYQLPDTKLCLKPKDPLSVGTGDIVDLLPSTLTVYATSITETNIKLPM